jgi:hypothetical protein
MGFSAKSVHKMGNFRLQEMVDLKNNFLILYKYFFTRREKVDFLWQKIEGEKFSKISVQVGHFQTARNTVIEKVDFLKNTNDF